jgi:hypothetical protein
MLNLHLHACLFLEELELFSVQFVGDTIVWLQRYVSASELNHIIRCVETMRSHLQQSNHISCRAQYWNTIDENVSNEEDLC